MISRQIDRQKKLYMHALKTDKRKGKNNGKQIDRQTEKGRQIALKIEK